MIADITITEKSFGPKVLMTGVRLSVDDGEKVGVVGRNGIGKSTLFGILTGADTDYTGEVIYKRGTSVVATAQEHHGNNDQTVMEYILQGLPEYAALHHIIKTYPAHMGDDLQKIDEYSTALERFGNKGFYQVEELVAEELKSFQMEGYGGRPLAALSGGQKRLVEVVKIMHADADLALLDEPTNHMDYVAKKQFIDWLKQSQQAMLIITHDRDVLQQVDRIVELKDGGAVSYRGNYDAYLKQNATSTSTAMNDYEMVEKRMVNLKQKVLDYQRLKEKSRNPGTIQRFKRLETMARDELAALEKVEKPTFWIDKESAENLNYKVAGQYQKYKAKNIKLSVKDGSMRSQRKLVTVRDLALGYDDILFTDVSFDLGEGEAVELRGRNGAGKSTLIKAILEDRDSTLEVGKRTPSHLHHPSSTLTIYDGTLALDPQVRVGVYEQEIGDKYLPLPLAKAIETMYLDSDLPISDTKIRQLLANYLFTEADGQIPLARLSGGQKARFQLIRMLANDPQLLVLDEPTNHLDLPSIEELESALKRYAGAVLYVSHDDYFRRKLGGDVVQVGAQ